MDTLKLIAFDKDDLEIISAHLQDAVINAGEIIWRPSEQRVVIPLCRFPGVRARHDHLIALGHSSPCTSTGERGKLLSKRKGAALSDTPLDLPQGTLDLLILKTLALEPRHGWAIAERLHQISSATLNIRQGSLYPALHRLERGGLIKARWGTSDNNRRAKYYELSKRGRTRLDTEIAAWRRLSDVVARVLENV